jgi:hypothetical protein
VAVSNFRFPVIFLPYSLTLQYFQSFVSQYVLFFIIFVTECHSRRAPRYQPWESTTNLRNWKSCSKRILTKRSWLSWISLSTNYSEEKRNLNPLQRKTLENWKLINGIPVVEISRSQSICLPYHRIYIHNKWLHYSVIMRLKGRPDRRKIALGRIDFWIENDGLQNFEGNWRAKSDDIFSILRNTTNWPRRIGEMLGSLNTVQYRFRLSKDLLIEGDWRTDSWIVSEHRDGVNHFDPIGKFYQSWGLKYIILKRKSFGKRVSIFRKNYAWIPTMWLKWLFQIENFLNAVFWSKFWWYLKMTGFDLIKSTNLDVLRIFK